MKSFLQGRTSVPLTSLHAPTRHCAGVRPAADPARTATSEGPQVEVVKEGDKVVRIVVICGCGERVDIECLYPAGG